MKPSRKKRRAPTQEEIIDQAQKILEERGTKALEMARQAVLEEKIECKEIKEALRYFMTEYWNDLVRPTLLSLVCEAVGGDPKLTNSVAVPMILISGAMDIHDDIIDESKVKQKRPTVFGKFGKNIALLTGDALMFKGLILLSQSLEDIPSDKRKAILETVRRMFFQLGDAEALELRFRQRLDVSPEEYLKVLEKKAADVEAHTRIGAILGDGTRDEIETLGKYGRLLGMLIVLGDDVMDSRDLSELRHRLQKEHLPLPLLYTLKNPRTKRAVTSILSERKITKNDIQTLIEIAKKDLEAPELLEKIVGEISSHLSLTTNHKKLEAFAKLFGDVSSEG